MRVQEWGSEAGRIAPECTDDEFSPYVPGRPTTDAGRRPLVRPPPALSRSRRRWGRLRTAGHVQARSACRGGGALTWPPLPATARAGPRRHQPPRFSVGEAGQPSSGLPCKSVMWPGRLVGGRACKRVPVPQQDGTNSPSAVERASRSRHPVTKWVASAGPARERTRGPRRLPGRARRAAAAARSPKNRPSGRDSCVRISRGGPSSPRAGGRGGQEGPHATHSRDAPFFL